VASIRKRTSDRTGETTWAVLWWQGKKQRSKTFITQKDAARFEALVEALGPDRALSALEDEAPTGITLDELAQKWWEAKRPDVTPRVHADYWRDYTNWIAPTLGHRGADHIREGDIQTWVDSMKGQLEPKTIGDRHALLHQIYAWGSAKTRQLVAHNPCGETKLPKKTRKLPKGLRLPEFYRLLTAAKAYDPDAHDLILFLGCTGWRIGEAVALTPACIDDDGRNMWVEMRQVWRRGEGLVEGGKSEAAGRRIRVLGEAVPMLRRRVVGLGPSDLLLTNQGKPWHKTTFRERRWLPIVKAAGLEDRKPTPHWLRHTHVLLCHAAGMSPAEIQRRLGHEDIKTTYNMYGRLIEDMDESVAQRLDLLLSGGGDVVAGEVLPAGEPLQLD
jgi:integrase